MNIKTIKYVYFLGIGGIGMSALARFFMDAGKQVTGYDRTPSGITDFLSGEGVEIHFEDNTALIPEQVRQHPDDCLVVYTPAIPKAHSELLYFQDYGFRVLKRSEVLGLITHNHFTIAVAGTHGKTTTSAFIAHLLKTAGVDCCVLVGGIMKNYNTNYLEPTDVDKAIYVVEADEYDRSFLQLEPDIAVITSMEADHLDIYGSETGLQEAFMQYATRLKPGGKLIVHDSIKKMFESTFSGLITYGNQQDSNYSIQAVRYRKQQLYFDAITPSGNFTGIALPTGGVHNSLNSLAAFAACKTLVKNDRSLVSGIETFKGIKRRFEFVYRSEQIVYIDDYAHHPTEITATLQSVKDLFPDKKLTGIFQPHLFTRTRDFMDGFATALSLLDEVILLDIYPAREQPIEGICSKVLLDKISVKHKLLLLKEDLTDYLKQSKLEILITLGAGDIDRLVAPINKMLKNRFSIR